MKALVTGAAGFIGSHLVDRLLDDGHEVVGLDTFTPYYPRPMKDANLRNARGRSSFELVEGDLGELDLRPLVEDAEVAFHLAAQPGVRLSWEAGFPDYVRHNITATQRLLEAVKGSSTRVVYASSSSIYGNASQYPTGEDAAPAPHSPYGVTKLAGEHLCRAYAANHQVQAVALRYFTVYGPRQRPDMALHRMVDAALRGKPFPLYGDGEQVRDFTFVADIVSATLAASTADVGPGTAINISGGSSASVRQLLELVGDAAGNEVLIDQQPAAPGDVERTGGSIDRARELLGWTPVTGLREGVEAQVRWHTEHAPNAETTG